MNEEQLKAINESLAANVLRLGNECRDLASEVERLKEQDRSQTAAHRTNTEMWKDQVGCLLVQVDDLNKENARLKDEAGITFRRLVLDHAGRTIEFVAKPLHDELAAELRLSESRVAMLRSELERRDERIRALVEEYSKR
jgi:predicted RNase H-like nuclease (RuvC/YqgF family)